MASCERGVYRCLRSRSLRVAENQTTLHRLAACLHTGCTQNMLRSVNTRCKWFGLSINLQRTCTILFVRPRPHDRCRCRCLHAIPSTDMTTGTSSSWPLCRPRQGFQACFDRRCSLLRAHSCRSQLIGQSQNRRDPSHGRQHSEPTQ